MRNLYLAGAVLGLGASSFAADLDGNPGPSRPGSLGSSGGSPLAGTVVFSDRDAFFASAGQVRTETFELEPWTADCDSAGSDTLAFSEFTATSQPASLKLLRDACFGNHNTTQGGKRYLGADTDSADVSAEVTFLFDFPLTAFGLWVVDVDEATLEIAIGEGTYTVPPTGDDGQAYFGLLSVMPFSSATFRIVDGVDSHYSFDDVTYSIPGGGPVSADEGVRFVDWGCLKASYR